MDSMFLGPGLFIGIVLCVCVVGLFWALTTPPGIEPKNTRKPRKEPIDIPNEIVNLRYQIIRTQMFLDAIIANNPEQIQPLNLGELDEAGAEAREIIIERYPGTRFTSE